MAQIDIIDEKTIKIHVTLDDAVHMVKQAAGNLDRYAQEVVTICDKMPEFEFTYFCFYAYNTAELFEEMLETDPKQYTSFSLDAPDSFFYSLYGGMTGLYDEAKSRLKGA